MNHTLIFFLNESPLLDSEEIGEMEKYPPMHCRMRSSAAHILALAVAEKPMEEHEIWLRDQARNYRAEVPASATQADVEAGLRPFSHAATTDTPDDDGGSRESATTSQSKDR